MSLSHVLPESVGAPPYIRFTYILMSHLPRLPFLGRGGRTEGAR